MKPSKPAALINSLLQSGRIESDVKEMEREFFFEPGPRKSIFFPKLDTALIFSGTGPYLLYEQTVRDLHNRDTIIQSNFSLEEFTNHFKKFLQNFIKPRADVTDLAYAEFVKQLKDLPEHQYTVIKGISGITLKHPETVLRLGKFNIYHLESHRTDIEKLTSLNPMVLWMCKQEPEFLIATHVVTRAQGKAEELANELFYQFELFAMFAVGGFHPKHQICINNFLQIPNFYRIIIQPDSVSTPPIQNHPIDFIPLDDPYLSDKGNGNAAIWPLLDPSSKTSEFNARVISAIEWCGKANSDSDVRNRLLQNIIALEAIFTFSEKNVLISPSVASTIAEGAAFLLFQKANERMDLVKRINRLYEIRSALAHGGRKHVTEDDATEASMLLNLIIRKILTSRQLVKITNMTELQAYLKKKKFR